MLIISPDEQLLNEVTFNTLSSDAIDDYYTTLITRTESRDELTLNGSPLPSNFWLTVTGNPELSYARAVISGDTDYTVIAPDGFISYVYGFGPIESFGYAAGASLENLNLEVVGVDDVIGVIVNEGCLNSPTIFSAEFEVPDGEAPRYNTFEWDFGDGNTSTEQSPTHTYTEPGTYQVFLLAANGTGACGTSETVNRTVTITDTEVEEFIGPVSVCPDVEGVVYRIEGGAGNTYSWTVIGGDIVSETNGPEIMVNWGAANDNAAVEVIPFNSLGCVGETQRLDVVINRRLQPALPTGPVEVCFADFMDVTYSTPPTNGSEYEWFVEGGSFIGGNDGNEVRVQWNGPKVTGRIWYREFNPAISNCEGFSEMVDVIIYEDIIITPQVTDVLCFGDVNGRVNFDVTGGVPGYNLRFEGNDISGTELTDLAAGNYTATIVDMLGCTQDVDFTIGTPDELTITEVNIMDVRCFEESNGSVLLTVTGGTPDANGAYSFGLTGNGRDITGLNEMPEVNGLPFGDYTITVTDQNGCTTSQPVRIDQPTLLEADLETLINQPICPDATNGTAFLEARGGVPDYQFFWSNNPDVDQQEGMNFSQGSYTVRIVDANGCEVVQQVDIVERFPRIYVPNAFSPNGDGENDLFRPVTDCNLQYSVQVFNNWGSVVYASSDITAGWDGTLNGKQAPIGKYSYIIFYSGALNGASFEETLRGTLRLVR
jgi:gliding motility-associated-like protein